MIKFKEKEYFNRIEKQVSNKLDAAVCSTIANNICLKDIVNIEQENYDRIVSAGTIIAQDYLDRNQRMRERNGVMHREGEELRISTADHLVKAHFSNVPQMCLEPTREFNPEIGNAQQLCPKCHKAMRSIGLVNEGSGMYCCADRIVIPL